MLDRGNLTMLCISPQGWRADIWALSYTRRGGEFWSHMPVTIRKTTARRCQYQLNTQPGSQPRLSRGTPEGAFLERGACFGYKLGKRDSTDFYTKTLTLPAVPGTRRCFLPSQPAFQTRPVGDRYEVTGIRTQWT